MKKIEKLLKKQVMTIDGERFSLIEILVAAGSIQLLFVITAFADYILNS